MTRWKDPQLQAGLAELSARGLSAAKIAERIGETKNAVALAMHRYGLFARTKKKRRRVAASDNGARHGD